LAIMEQRDGALRKVSFEVLAAARTLADASGGQVHALVLGAGAVTGTEQLGRYGADAVKLATHPAFALGSPDAATAVIGAQPGYGAVLFAATAQGRDLAPRAAARLGAACATDVTALGVEGGSVTVTRPIYAGKVLQRATLTGTAVVSVRPNTFAPVEHGKAGAVEPVEVPAFTARVTVTDIKKPEAAKLDVTEASVVVSGGRGLKEPEHFALVESLAAAFGNAAVGASRAVVDAGWRDHGEQVGQTGKTVSPQLYVAIGISGAIQHLAGMRTAKTIVAINRDKDAPIFKVADYGIVGDLFEIVPRLTEAVRQVRSER
ncbi:MAG: electron transfer flavoprotein subunit alpha/FixB family protein, partial [Gemmatimonadales bacterium]|nr:electron transfer flavoprotein subunit alpha/FixB family protein [Gemmatimonadales bacterium]